MKAFIITTCCSFGLYQCQWFYVIIAKTISNIADAGFSWHTGDLVFPSTMFSGIPACFQKHHVDQQLACSGHIMIVVISKFAPLNPPLLYFPIALFQSLILFRQRLLKSSQSCLSATKNG